MLKLTHRSIFVVTVVTPDPFIILKKKKMGNVNLGGTHKGKGPLCVPRNVEITGLAKPWAAHVSGDTA